MRRCSQYIARLQRLSTFAAILMYCIYWYANISQAEDHIFYTHNDHLGSGYAQSDTYASGLFPYFGDLAKVGKIRKDLGIISNAIESVNKGVVNKFSNSRKMTNKEISEFFGDKIYLYDI